MGKKLLLLNSYRLTDTPPLALTRNRYFIAGLAAEGFTKDEDYRIELIDSNDLHEMENAAKKILEKGDVDLIHAVGTPLAVLAGDLTGKIPIVYYGAHPQNAGLAECSRGNICGMQMMLPFTSHYKEFRFLRELFPRVRNIYVPFYSETVFCIRELKERQEAFKSKYGNQWVPMNSEFIGYTSLSGLCYIIGINYFEFLYHDAGELKAALESIDSDSSMIMVYNDTVYCNAAPQTAAEAASKKAIPFLWNNNPDATRIGCTAAIAGCFKEVGTYAGTLAGKIFKGAKPADFSLLKAGKKFASINLNNAKKIGLEIPDSVLNYFDEILE